MAEFSDVEPRGGQGAAAEGEQRLQRLFDRMPIGVAEVDCETGRLLRVNTKLCEIVDWDTAELMAMRWSDLVHRDERDSERAARRSTAGGTIVGAREVRLVSKRGQVRWVHVQSSLNSEATDRMIVTVEDITGLVEARTELARQNTRQRAVLDALPAGVALIDAFSGSVISVNARLAEILQRPKYELVGEELSGMVHPADRERTVRALTGARGNGAARELENRYLRRDGSEVWAHTRVTPLGAAEGMNLATIDDITDRRAKELAIWLQGSALEAASDAIAIASVRGEIEWVNPAYTRLTGRTLADAHTDPLREILVAANGGEWRGELERRRADGTRYHEELRITPVADSTGTITHLVAIGQDITIRKQVEDVLRREEAQLRAVFEALPIPMGLARRDGTILSFNQAFTDTFGYTAADAPTIEAWQTLALPDAASLQRGRDRIERLGRGLERTSSGIQTFRCRDGSTREAELIVRRVGELIIAVYHDVTERQQMVERLQASEERYRSLVDNLADIVFTLDGEGRVTFLNQAVAGFGYVPDQLIGRPFIELVAPEDRARALDSYRARLAGEQYGAAEYRLLDATGKHRHTRVTLQRVDGGFVGIVVDVTETRNTEDQLRAAQKLEAIGRLAGGVAHDFNNLLTVILSYSDFAQQGLREEDPLRDDLQQIIDATTRASTLTRRLLAFSRKQVLAPQPVEVHSLVDSLGKMLGRLIGEDIELEILPAVGSTWAMADPGQIEQVVMNLAINARDAMPDGGHLLIEAAFATVTDSAAALEIEPGDYVRLTIRDTGCGMDEATRTRIFEPFFTTKPVGKGTGLGLSVVYGIVKQSRGGIAVETYPGVGTTFSIYLPATTADALSPSTARVRSSRGKETILVVEDERPVRAVAERVLLAAGYTVLAAGTPSEALDLASKFGSQIELVFTDVVMPEMNGRELTDRLRQFAPQAKVLFTSGYTDDALARSGVLAREFLPKPYDPVLLEQRIRALLDRT